MQVIFNFPYAQIIFFFFSHFSCSMFQRNFYPNLHKQERPMTWMNLRVERERNKDFILASQGKGP